MDTRTVRNVVLGLGLAACGGGTPPPVEPAPEPVPVVETEPAADAAPAVAVEPEPPPIEPAPPPPPCVTYYATVVGFDGDALRACSPDYEQAPVCTTIARDGTITGPIDAPPPVAGPDGMLAEDGVTVSFCQTPDACIEIVPAPSAPVRQLEVSPDGQRLAVLTESTLDLHDASGARILSHRVAAADAQVAWLGERLLVLGAGASLYEIKGKKLVLLGKPIGERISAWGVIGAGKAALLDTERVRIVDLKTGKQTKELAFEWMFGERNGDAEVGSRLRNEGTVRMAVRDDGTYALIALDGADARVGFASLSGGTPVVVDAEVCDE